MTRDELIEELKKAPADSEVYILVTMRDRYSGGSSRYTLKVDRINTIPNIVIEAE